METYTVTVSVTIDGDNYEDEAMEEAVQEWVASRLGYPDAVTIVADEYEIRKVEIG